LNIANKSTSTDVSSSDIPSFIITRDVASPIFPLDTEGYEFVDQLSWKSNGNTGLLVSIDDQEEWFDISEVKATLLSHVTPNSYNTLLPQEEMTFLLTGELANVKLVIETCDLNNPEYRGSNRYYLQNGDSCYGWILVQRK